MKKKDLKPIELNTPRAQKMKKLARLTRLPLIKQIYKKLQYPDGLSNQTASPIPINICLGTYEDHIIPLKVTEYFVKKAGTIVLMDCPCRTANKCKNHDVHLGCTWFGKGAAKMDLSKWPNAHYATKEEALERERLAYENGLVPHLGKLRSDAALYGVLDYQNEFMDICHCCSCCCVVSLTKYGPKEYKEIIKRMEGVLVTTDPEKCVGCGQCFKVCIYNGLKMVKGKSVHIQDNCMGCGRCERVCPNGAISIKITNYSGIDKLIARFEDRVDISG